MGSPHTLRIVGAASLPRFTQPPVSDLAAVITPSTASPHPFQGAAFSLATSGMPPAGQGIGGIVSQTLPRLGGSPLGNPQETSKIYRRSMEMVGGTANLVASDITDWLGSLWHGRNLAYTLAVITLVAAYGFFFITEDS